MDECDARQRSGFFGSLNDTAIIRAMFPNNIFVPNIRSVHTQIILRLRNRRADVQALIDSGATENFIHQKLVKRFHIPTIPLRRPKIARNVDGTLNQAGRITNKVELEIQYQGTTKMFPFFVTNLGQDNIILGYPFLQVADPEISWKKGTMKGHVFASTYDAHKWKVLSQIRKTTTSTQLAINETQKKDQQTWDQIVPRRYHQFRKVFSEEESKRLPQSKPWDHAIDLKPDAPSSFDCKIYPLSPKEQEALEEFLKEHQEKKYIEPSKSPYTSPFFFVKKKDGKLRPVQDYRQLNEWTIPNNYPLPLIRELIPRLAEKHHFSKIDVRWGYNNILIRPEDQHKAAFKTNRGFFEPKVMYFGMRNAPATFQSMMDHIFREQLATGNVFIYMDDILIATKGTWDDHYREVEKVLKTLQDNDLYLKPEKCEFHKQEVEYLGMVVGKGRIKMDPVKVQGIADWPTPTTVKELRAFLGFGNFYKDFIDHYSLIARPLHDLTKKSKQWEWTPLQDEAFQCLKQKFISYPILRNADQNRPFILETDASDFAIGATLIQEFEDGLHPVAFFSRSLNPAERNYDIYDRELLAIVEATRFFKPYLLGARHQIIVRSDHNNLKYFKSPKKVTPRQARWMNHLADYNFIIHHLPGKQNTIADLLSRRKDLERGMNNAYTTVLPENLFLRTTYLPNDNQKR